MSAPSGHVNSLLLAAGLLTAGAVAGKLAGTTKTGISAAIAGGLIAGVFSPRWREVAFATSAFGGATLLINDIAS